MSLSNHREWFRANSCWPYANHLGVSSYHVFGKIRFALEKSEFIKNFFFALQLKIQNLLTILEMLLCCRNRFRLVVVVPNHSTHLECGDLCYLMMTWWFTLIFFSSSFPCFTLFSKSVYLLTCCWFSFVLNSVCTQFSVREIHTGARYKLARYQLQNR